MAVGGSSDLPDISEWTVQFGDNLQEQHDEVMVLRSMFEDDAEERLRVLSEAPEVISDKDDRNSNMYSIQLSVPIKHNGEQLHVDVCLPAENYDNETETKGDNQTAKFKRSDSGNRLMGTFTVKYLTPVNLSVVLPPEYPSCSPPYFTLSCLWMSYRQLSTLCQMLDKLWEESSSMPILYTWMDWLENNCCSFLGIEEQMVIMQEVQLDEFDPRAVQEAENIDDAITVMLRFDRQEERKEFRSNNQECLVCYMEYPGSQFYRINQCKHHFCVDCMASYCSLHVKEGTVLELQCLDHDCKNEIPPYMIKEVLTQNEYERWENLTLLKGLDKMGDILWCERCKGPVVHDKSDAFSVAHCLNCNYSFCTKCGQSAHQGSRCKSVQDEINETQEKLKQQKEEDESVRFELARKLKQLKEESDSKNYLKNKTRQCPSCSANVIKIAGCNKVVCTVCSSSMCWGCGVDITQRGYSHFSDYPQCGVYQIVYDDDDNGDINVPLFNRGNQRARFVQPRNQNNVDMDERIQQDPTIAQRIKRCPVCKQRNMRSDDGNNHIKCWGCKNNFCFLCLTLIKGSVTTHFNPTNSCKQHTKSVYR